MNKVNSNKTLVLCIMFILCLTTFISISNNIGETSQQNFVVNSGSKVLLDVDSDVTYNGTISITVTSGVGINATINSITMEIDLEQTKIFNITDTNSIYFEVSSEGYSEGSFILNLNIDPTNNGKNPTRTIIGVLAAIILVVSVITYLVRAKKLEPKEGEKEEELVDPEAARKREEAAGAEKKFWGLDKE